MAKLSFEQGRVVIFSHIRRVETIDRAKRRAATVSAYTLRQKTDKNGYPGPAVRTKPFITERL
jgi:hypothetical protein